MHFETVSVISCCKRFYEEQGSIENYIIFVLITSKLLLSYFILFHRFAKATLSKFFIGTSSKLQFFLQIFLFLDILEVIIVNIAVITRLSLTDSLRQKCFRTFSHADSFNDRRVRSHLLSGVTRLFNDRTAGC